MIFFFLTPWFFNDAHRHELLALCCDLVHFCS